MKIAEIVDVLEQLAPPSYQESYDNAGLLTGSGQWECSGIICTLDATAEVLDEAIRLGCNLVVAHHPIVFGGLKKINGKNYVEQAVIAAIKNDIAIYAIHTNLDNILHGVNATMAKKLGLVNTRVLQEKQNNLMKLIVFVPVDHAEQVRAAVFNAGGGSIGNYSECSFNTEGKGTFKAGEDADPYVGTIGERHEEPEMRIEIIFPGYLKLKVVEALLAAHPYEEVAYDIIPLGNYFKDVGSGLVGDLPQPLEETALLQKLKDAFGLQVIRHTPLLGKPVSKVALCGGAGSFLISRAAAAGANFYITGDVKYHEFFDANNRMVIADIGHWESEQFTVGLLYDVLVAKFPNFAVQKTRVKTNPVNYFI